MTMKRTCTAESAERLETEEDIRTPDVDIIREVTLQTEKAHTVHGLVVGTVSGFSGPDSPLVNFPQNPTGRPLPSRSTVELTPAHIGRAVALMFEMNDVRKPIVIGLMHVPETRVDIVKDGEPQVISAEREIVLCCGASSIRLQADGKIIIKGREILSRAKGNHKIQGGMVYIN
jgi:hypothetical protein